MGVFKFLYKPPSSEPLFSTIQVDLWAGLMFWIQQFTDAVLQKSTGIRGAT